MAKVRIEGHVALNGEYEFDPGYFTNKELRLIKQVSGVRAGEIEDALSAGDNDLLIAFALIAMSRNGRDTPAAAFDDMRFGSIAIDFSDDEEADDGPPESTPASEPSGDGSTSPS